MKFLIALVVTAVLALPSVAAAKRQNKYELHRSAHRVGVFQRATWGCQDTLDAPRTKASTSIWSLPKSVKYRRWAARRWHQRANRCKRELVRRTIPFTFDWETAVRIVQRVYPGTKDWMLYISDREGGNGPWVWYSGSCGDPPCLWRGYHTGSDFLGHDTVGGWMQFRFSTFEPYWRQAQADLKSRGYIIPNLKMPPAGGDPQYVGWLNPLGQAVTAGFMRYYHKDGCHWCL